MRLLHMIVPHHIFSTEGVRQFWIHWIYKVISFVIMYPFRYSQEHSCLQGNNCSCIVADHLQGYRVQELRFLLRPLPRDPRLLLEDQLNIVCVVVAAFL